MKKNKILTRDEYKEKCKKLSIAAIVSMAFNILMLLLIILSCVFGGKSPKQVNAESLTTSVVKLNAINEKNNYISINDIYSSDSNFASQTDLQYSKLYLSLVKEDYDMQNIIDLANLVYEYAISTDFPLNDDGLTYNMTIPSENHYEIGGYNYNRIYGMLQFYPSDNTHYIAKLLNRFDYYDSYLGNSQQLCELDITLYGLASGSAFTWYDFNIEFFKIESYNLIQVYDTGIFIYHTNYAHFNTDPTTATEYVYSSYMWTLYYLGQVTSGDNVVLASGLNPNAWFTSDLSSGFFPNFNVNTDTYLFENHLFTINGNIYDSIYVTSTPVNAINYKSVGSEKEYSFQSASYNDYRYVMYLGAKDSRGINANILLLTANWYDRYNSSSQFIGKGLYINSFSWVSDTYRNIQFYSDIDNTYTDYTNTLPVGGNYDIKTILTFNNSLGSSTLINGNVGGDIGNVFTLVGSAFTSLLPILSAQLLPGITIGVLLFIPLVAILVFAIIKIIKK